MAPPSPADVVDFWRNAGPMKWFAKSDAFDAEIRERFEAAHFAAARREFDGWRAEPEGTLALLLLLDQFPRNLWRGSGHAFATDPLALSIARDAVAAGEDRRAEAAIRVFFYLPFEHSERLEDQEEAVRLCAGLEAADQLKWAEIHRDIIVRFGRFPHRNAALGRQTTAEEQAFLDGGGFSG